MKKYLHAVLISLVIVSSALAQPSLSRMQSKLLSQGAINPAGIDFRMQSPSQGSIFFGANMALPETQARQWIEDQLEIRANVDAFRMDVNIATTESMEVKKLHQYYKGIKVEHGTINVSTSNGRTAMIQLEFYPIQNGFNIRATITEKEALQKALAFAPASLYEWATADSALNAANAPHGELVIIKNYEAANEVCLAYKFKIYTLIPASAAFIYVNAWNGNIVLNDPLMRHIDQNTTNIPDTRKAPSSGVAAFSNTPKPTEKQKKNLLPYSNIQGTAATRYNGTQVIFTDYNTNELFYPYRLRGTRNGVNIETYNFQRLQFNNINDYYATAIDFTDNDNDWSAAEHNNLVLDDAALSVQFNMQIISDYWWKVHNRRGWDNANSTIKSYVHVYELKLTSTSPDVYGTFYLKNAFWFNGRMTFGDGGNTTASQPYTPLDISAHEMGHAITETTSGLVYQWESGALSEGFSDIWAACVTDYAKQEFAVTGENTWRIAEKCENVGATNVGFRDMSNPPLFSHPSAYKNPNWKPASLQTCRVLTSNNDECGVHSNSGVLNKWFFLITEGQAGTNSFGTPFAVTGLGFATSEKIAYLTSLNLTPNASYQTCRTVSLNATATLYGNTSAQYQSVWNAWVAVAVDSNVYNMSNTPVFATNNFTSIAVGKNGVVLAGTNYSGYYKFEDNAWTKFSDLPDVRFNDIKADYNGDFWMAQSGRLGTQNGGSGISGGVSYLKAPFTGPSSLYTVGAQADVPSRNGRCIYIDTFRNTALINPNVWVATLAYITSNASTSGMLGHGLNLGTPAFTKVNSNINIASGTVGCLTMSGNKTTIWTFVQANNGVNQLLTYDAVTNAFIASFDHISHPVIPSGFVARSIYCDAKGRTWVGLATGGILVYDERNTWHYLSGTGFPQLFPSGSQASFNAITGTKEGDVYIGTTTGIVYFERGDGLLDKIDQAASYKAFGKPNGLPSNVINAIAYDTSRFKLLVATDSGIVFWEPLCINPYCKTYKSAATTDVETTGGGNWSNTATWGSGKIPDSLTNVNIKHAITVDINGQCSSLIVSPPGSVNVAAGKKLVIYDQKEATIYSGNQRRKRR